MIKVTECWCMVKADHYPNHHMASLYKQHHESRPAVLLWREDYEAMRRELEETKKALGNALIQLGLMDGDIRLLQESRND